MIFSSYFFFFLFVLAISSVLAVEDNNPRAMKRARIDTSSIFAQYDTAEKENYPMQLALDVDRNEQMSFLISEAIESSDIKYFQKLKKSNEMYRVTPIHLINIIKNESPVSLDILRLVLENAVPDSFRSNIETFLAKCIPNKFDKFITIILRLDARNNLSLDSLTNILYKIAKTHSGEFFTLLKFNVPADTFNSALESAHAHARRNEDISAINFISAQTNKI